MEENDLDSFLKIALEKADQAEIYSENSRTLLLKNVLDRIESLDSKSVSGYSLRVVKDGRVGFSYFSNPSEFKRALRNALQSSKFSRKLDVSFPSEQKYNKIRGLYSKDLEETTEHELSDLLIKMIDVGSNFRAHTIENVLSVNVLRGSMINSNGGNFEDESTFLSALSLSQYRDSMSFASNSLRKIFDVEKLAERSAILAEKFEGGRPIRGEFDIILHPHVILGFLNHVFEEAIDGEEVYRGNSYFSDKVGNKVASDNLTIYDDSEIPYGIGSSCHDDEGMKKASMKIIDNGIFKDPIYDLESAALAGKATTGNGFRAGFTSLPVASFTNIRAESKEREKLMEVDGIFIYDVMGFHNIVPANGDFALEISNGCFFKDYKTIKPIKKCSIVGNFFDLLQNVRLLDDDQQVDNYYGPSWVYKGKII